MGNSIPSPKQRVSVSCFRLGFDTLSLSAPWIPAQFPLLRVSILPCSLFSDTLYFNLRIGFSVSLKIRYPHWYREYRFLAFAVFSIPSPKQRVSVSDFYPVSDTLININSIDFINSSYFRYSPAINPSSALSQQVWWFVVLHFRLHLCNFA